jgi:hypothetical protein
MQRKPDTPQHTSSQSRLIKPGQPFSNLPASEQDTGPLPLLSTPPWATEQYPAIWDNAPKAPRGRGSKRRDVPNWHQKIRNRWSSLSRRRRILISIVSVFLAILIVGGTFAATFLQNLLNSKSLLAAPPTIQVSIDAQAIHTLIAQGLNTSQDSVSDVNIVPMPNNGVKISLTMLISGVSGPGVNRKLPMELDTTLGGTTGADKNILTVNHFIRDGVDAGPDAAANMTVTINQLLKKFLPLPGTATKVDIGSVFGTGGPGGGSLSESNSRVCGQGSMLLHLGLPVQTQPGHVLPINVDSYVGLDQKGNLQFHLDRITYGNGSGIGTLGTNVARQVINQILTKPGSSNSPSISANDPINQIKFLSLGTSTVPVCGKNDEMVVIQLGPAPGK